jgi:hypothetical protein
MISFVGLFLFVFQYSRFMFSLFCHFIFPHCSLLRLFCFPFPLLNSFFFLLYFCFISSFVLLFLIAVYLCEGKVISLHAMKVYGAVAVLLHPFLTWPQIDVSGQFRALTALLLGYSLNRRFDGPQNRSGRSGEDTIFCPCRELNLNFLVLLSIA